MTLIFSFQFRRDLKLSGSSCNPQRKGTNYNIFKSTSKVIFTNSINIGLLFILSITTANAAVISGKVSDLRTCQPGRDDGKHLYADDHTTIVGDSNAVPVPNIAVSLKNNPSVFTLTDENGEYSIEAFNSEQTILFQNTALTSGTFYTMERPLLDFTGEDMIFNRQAMLVDRDPIEDEDKLVIIKHYAPNFLDPNPTYILRYTNFPISFNFRDSPLDPGQAAKDLVIEGILRWNEDIGFDVAEFTAGEADCEVVWIESGTNQWRATGVDSMGNPTITEVWLQYDLLTSFDEVAQGEFGRNLGIKGEYYSHPSHHMDTPFENESRVSDFEKIFIKEMLRFYHNDFPSGVGAIAFYSEPSTFTYHINEPPTADSLTINPDSGYRSTLFTAEFQNPIDPEGEDLTFGYQWQQYEGSLWIDIAGETSNTITNVIKRTAIRTSGTLSDGIHSVDFLSSSVLILNSPPTFESATIVPQKASRDTLLTVEIEGWNDADGDIEGYRYQWMRNGEDLVGETGVSLDPSSLSPGDRISCVIIAWDGESEGTSKETPAVVLQNRTKDSMLILY